MVPVAWILPVSPHCSPSFLSEPTGPSLYFLQPQCPRCAILASHAGSPEPGLAQREHSLSMLPFVHFTVLQLSASTGILSLQGSVKFLVILRAPLIAWGIRPAGLVSKPLLLPSLIPQSMVRQGDPFQFCLVMLH